MTTHPDSITTLPGTLPGLLRRGAPVIHPKFGRGLVLNMADEAPVVFDRVGMSLYSRQHLNDDDLLLIALDMTDPAGRDVAARWAAGRLGLAVGATAPIWFGDRFGYGLTTSAAPIYPSGKDDQGRKVAAYFYAVSRPSPHFAPDCCHYGIEGINTDDAIAALALACLSLASI